MFRQPHSAIAMDLALHLFPASESGGVVSPSALSSVPPRCQHCSIILIVFVLITIPLQANSVSGWRTMVAPIYTFKRWSMPLGTGQSTEGLGRSGLGSALPRTPGHQEACLCEIPVG